MEKRNTTQKKAVEECLVELGHPSASALYRAVHERYPAISRATVFRILKERADEGMALRLPVGDHEDRYDATVLPHYHVRCTACGRVDDIELAPESVPCPKENSGYLIEGHILAYLGLCPTCRAAAERNQSSK